jgi:molybdopterin-guanine dinucleotide biosynthesis protein A
MLCWERWNAFPFHLGEIGVMSQTIPHVSGIILAGGQSRRMGRDKAFIELGGKPIIQRALDAVRAVCTETIIVANDTETYARWGARVVSDVFPGKGALGGVFSGLQAAREVYALAVACDMPFLNVELLRYLVSLAPAFDVVIPRADDPSAQSVRGDGRSTKRIGLHPLHAVYSKNCLAAMETRLKAGDLRLIGFPATVRVVEAEEIDRFDGGHWSFFNVNTAEDLIVAQSNSHVVASQGGRYDQR